MNHWHAFQQQAQRRLLQLCLLLLCATGIIACGGGGSGSTPATPPTNTAGSLPPPPATVPPANADIKVLMIGNSHTFFADLPTRLDAMLRAGNPGKSVAVVVAPASLFLDEHLNHPPTLALLRSQPWNYVILQAQKYSNSGAVNFSITEAVTLVGLVRQVNAVPVLYPEWARLGAPETDRIYAPHVAIAQQAPACVAPIGQAWDLALQRHPGLTLHYPDGNHAAAAGAQLTALMLYATLSGKLPNALPDFPFPDVTAPIQQQLRAVANDTVAAFPPRRYCPQDRP